MWTNQQNGHQYHDMYNQQGMVGHHNSHQMQQQEAGNQHANQNGNQHHQAHVNQWVGFSHYFGVRSVGRQSQNISVISDSLRQEQ